MHQAYRCAVRPSMQGLIRRGRYLHALEALRESPFLARCKRTTRLRLQMELHSLTQARAPGVLQRLTLL